MRPCWIISHNGKNAYHVSSIAFYLWIQRRLIARLLHLQPSPRCCVVFKMECPNGIWNHKLKCRVCQKRSDSIPRPLNCARDRLRWRDSFQKVIRGDKKLRKVPARSYTGVTIRTRSESPIGTDPCVASSRCGLRRHSVGRWVHLTPRSVPSAKRRVPVSNVSYYGGRAREHISGTLYESSDPYIVNSLTTDCFVHRHAADDVRWRRRKVPQYRLQFCWTSYAHHHR